MFDIIIHTINSFQNLQARLSDNIHTLFDKAGLVFADQCTELFEVMLQSIRPLIRPRQRYIVEHKRTILAQCEST